jgi:SP family general alpha glucoside:H+ symporter-like MFS transporter
MSPRERKQYPNRNLSTGGLSVFCMAWCYFGVPEMKGRTYEELDLMFARGVRTREFGDYKIE